MTRQSHLRRLPADPEQAGAFVLADVSAPADEIDPDRVHDDYALRMAAAGIENDSGYLLKSLTRRLITLETLWQQLASEIANTPAIGNRNVLYRNLSRLSTDLDKTAALIVRVRQAERGGFAPTLSHEEQNFLDDPGKQVEQLTNLERVRLDAKADEVYEAEYAPAGEALIG